MNINDIKLIGVMGGGIAESCIVGGFRTIVRDVSDELCKKTRDTMIEGRFGLRGAVERGKLTSLSFVAETPGVFKFACKSHQPTMTGELVVLAR